MELISMFGEEDEGKLINAIAELQKCLKVKETII